MTRRTTTRRGARPADRAAADAPAQGQVTDRVTDRVTDQAGPDATDATLATDPAGATDATEAAGPASGAAPDDEAVLAIEGELTIHYAAERRAELLALVERGDRLGLDLSEVTELDTAGLQLLLLARREAVQQGKTFEIRAASKAVTEALQIVHLGLALEPLAPAAGGTR